MTDDPARAEGSGTTTECPLDGVHEHSFRGPHTFTEWYPARASGLLREAAENVSDRRTVLDDGFWVSRKEMRALDLALGREDIGTAAALAATEPGLDDDHANCHGFCDCYYRGKESRR